MEKEKTPAVTRSLANVILDAGRFGSNESRFSVKPTARHLKLWGFLKKQKKNRWELKPVGGEELEVLAQRVIAQPPEVIERMKQLLGE